MHSILARRLESEILLCIGSKTKFRVDSLFITCRFCYEVAALSWWEKKMAATLFAEVPTTSMVHAFQIDIDMYWMESVRRHVSHCVCLGRSSGTLRERRKVMQKDASCSRSMHTLPVPYCSLLFLKRVHVLEQDTYFMGTKYMKFVILSQNGFAPWKW